ncbi:hypothetical protein ASZ90_017445 [hydrocarbon metagenome]|uniref:Uncharacterized protein n=1 Tax=hydrocarbon metagenome TaxID=938273 RepID=A0A0W8E922_9ZZZZ
MHHYQYEVVKSYSCGYTSIGLQQVFAQADHVMFMPNNRQSQQVRS